MKKWYVWLLAALLLCGCGAEETLETIADEPVQAVMAQPREISVVLPEGLAVPTLECNAQQLYLSQDYEIMLETLSAGDLNATIQAITGYEKEKLTILETQQQDITRYECVWACAGEAGDRLGRAVILDDGQYHYCLSVLRDAEEKSQVVWSEVFSSFTLS